MTDRSTRVPGPPLVMIAYLGFGLVVLSYLAFAVRVATVVDARLFVSVALAGALLGATLLRSTPQRLVAAVGLGTFTILGGYYVLRFFGLTNPVTLLQSMAVDSVALLAGGTLLRIFGVEYWLIAVIAPATFFAWYSMLRGRAVLAVGTAGLLVVLFTLTGDLPMPTTLVAISGSIIAVGAHRLHRHGGDLVGVSSVLTVAAAVVVISLAVLSLGGLAVAGIAPGDDTGGDGPAPDEDPAATEEEAEAVNLEDTLGVERELQPTGSVTLDPEPRFVVETDEPTLFRTEVYDRYTGDGWVRTDGAAGVAPLPEGESRTVEQEFQIVTPMQSLPTAAMPASVTGLESVDHQRSPRGLIQADTPVDAETGYTVTAEQVNASTETLDAAGDDYPDEVVEQHTQLPSDVPTRVYNLTADVTTEAETPYQTALVIEEYLANQREYSLNVQEPGDNVADQFLFEMEAGYCTYYATTMVVMLRAENIPARMVSGYNTGYAVDDDNRVVTGADAHAWVEVYVPDVGWVTFDPTPSGNWEQARLDAIEAADVDFPVEDSTNATTEPVGNETTGDADFDPEEGLTDEELDPLEQLNDPPEVSDIDPDQYEATGVPQQLPGSGQLPQMTLWLIVLTGITALGVRFTRIRRNVQPVRMSYQRRHDPASDIERAVDRLEWLLGWRYVPRKQNETPAEYLTRLPATVDGRVREVYDTYETARYGGAYDDAAVEEAVTHVDHMIREHIPIVGRLFRDR